MQFLFLFFCTVFAYEHSFELSQNEFLLDKKPFQIIGGAFHYFRVHPDYWEDRLMKMKATGLNTVETYVAWNIHEPERGVYNWKGYGDLERFIEIAKKVGLFVVLRPGPYICAEWEFGGIPYWVLEDEKMVIRANNDLWKEAVVEYFTTLLRKMKPLLIENGGNILMVQVENEYGLFGCDHDYMRWLYNFMKSQLEPQTILFTTDPAGALRCGTIEETYTTVDFGVGASIEKSFNTQREYNPIGPLMNSEFYPGWLSHWDSPFQRVPTEKIVNHLKQMLEMRASVNFYMFYGGTNWGFYAGSNGGGDSFQADTTSYDYDAPLSEAGDATSKLLAIRDYLSKYLNTTLPPVPSNTTKASYGKIKFDGGVSLFKSLDNQGRRHFYHPKPLKFEQLGNAFGYVLYRTNVSDSSDKKLSIGFVRDRIIVYLNQEFKGIIWRTNPVAIDLGKGVGELDLLVENMGRLNFGGDMQDPKGIMAIYINGKEIDITETITLPMDSTEGLQFSHDFPLKGPMFYHASLDIVGKPADTFFNMKGWTHGHVKVNGFNLGRYWEVGPQFTLFVPAPILKQHNEIVIFEDVAAGNNAEITSQDYPIIE